LIRGAYCGKASPPELHAEGAYDSSGDYEGDDRNAG